MWWTIIRIIKICWYKNCFCYNKFLNQNFNFNSDVLVLESTAFLN